MFLILLTVLLAGLKFFEVSIMDDVSWWWVAGVFFLTFIWFEVFERLFGFDKKQLHEQFDTFRERRKRLLSHKAMKNNRKHTPHQ